MMLEMRSPYEEMASVARGVSSPITARPLTSSVNSSKVRVDFSIDAEAGGFLEMRFAQ